MAYMNLPEEEKRTDIIYVMTGKKADALYSKLSNRGKVFLRACLMDASVEDLKMLIGFDGDKLSAKKFCQGLLGGMGVSLPYFMFVLEAAEFDSYMLLAVKSEMQNSFELKKRSLFQRIFNL